MQNAHFFVNEQIEIANKIKYALLAEVVQSVKI